MCSKSGGSLGVLGLQFLQKGNNCTLSRCCKFASHLLPREAAMLYLAVSTPWSVELDLQGNEAACRQQGEGAELKIDGRCFCRPMQRCDSLYILLSKTIQSIVRLMHA